MDALAKRTNRPPAVLLDRPARVLVVESDAETRAALEMAFQREGYLVCVERNPAAVPYAAARFKPDLVVAGGANGGDVTRRLRRSTDVSVLVISTSNAVEDRLEALDAGGDDYLAKPFAVGELLARTRVLLRRAGRSTATVWHVGDLVVDEGSHTASRAGATLALTPLEFALLTAFCRQPGRVLRKRQLLAQIWGHDWLDPNVVEVRISDLRRKLEAHGPRVIHTVRGVGYVLRT